MELPPEYVACINTVEQPFDILCGHRQPQSPEEGELVRRAVEAMFVCFIELMLVIQLKYLEIHNEYKLLSRDSIHRHAACAMLGKGPTSTLTQSDTEVCMLVILLICTPNCLFASRNSAISIVEKWRLLRRRCGRTTALHFSSFLNASLEHCTSLASR